MILILALDIYTFHCSSGLWILFAHRWLHKCSDTKEAKRKPSWLHLISPSWIFVTLFSNAIIINYVTIIDIMITTSFFFFSFNQGEAKQVRQIGLVINPWYLWSHLYVNKINILKFQWTWHRCTSHPGVNRVKNARQISSSNQKTNLPAQTTVFASLLTTMCVVGAVNLVIMPSGEPSSRV